MSRPFLYRGKSPGRKPLRCGDCKLKRGAEIKRQLRRENPERMREILYRWRKENSARTKQIAKKSYDKRYQEGSDFRIATQLRNRLRNALVATGARKQLSAVEMLGCSIPHFREWLELKFLPGMTWENWGDWEIDHIRPCASFDLSDPKQQQACFEYLNLQPLWKKDNRRKSDKH